MYISIFFQLTSVEEAKSKFRPNDFNKTVILQYLTNILDSPDMRRQNSVFLFNLGVHYPISLNFTTYRDLVDSVIKLLRRKANLQLSAKSVGVFEAFYNSLKPIQLVNYSLEIAKPGKLYHSH